MFQLLLACILLLAWVPWCINRWRYRHIPGPFAPPVLGNLIAIGRLDMIAFIDQCRHKYGKIFKIYIGSNMLVCVSDPSAAKRMLAKLNFRHSGIQLTAGEEDWDFLVDGLVGANGSAWRALRPAWQPAFSPTALASYLPATHTAIEHLIQRLKPAADSGVVVELTRELTALTLDVVGQAAYGVDLHELQTHLQQQQQQQQALTTGIPSSSGSDSDSDSLLSNMQAVFDGGGVSNSSAYMAPVLLFPAFTKLWQWMAFHRPDRKLRTLAKARHRIRQVSLALLHSWRPSQHSSSQQPNTHSSKRQQNTYVQSNGQGFADSTAHTAAPAGVDSNGCSTGGSLQAGIAKLRGVQPGAFPRTLLEARDKQTGQPLSGEQIVAQLNTFLLAAFESTAAAMAFTVYFIAQHSAVEQRLVQELKAVQSQYGSTTPGQLDLTQLPYTEAVIQESLRLLPPGSIATRSTEQQGLKLSPVVWLPHQTALFACIYSMQRDPDYWPHALEFRPERWLPEGTALQPNNPDAYMPFGNGGRLCVGKQFANQAIIATIARLYQQYTVELVPGQVPLPVKQTFALVPAKGLRVRLHRRN